MGDCLTDLIRGTRLRDKVNATWLNSSGVSFSRSPPAATRSFRFLFPEDGTYGDVSVRIESGDEAEGYVLRNLTVNKAELKAYCIMGWSVDSEPPKGFLGIHEKIRSAIGLNLKNALMLICKDGCARSGLFCLVDTESERLRTKGRLRFTETVKHIRFHRSNCFDTQELFEAGWSIVMELAKQKKNA
uniref:protein-tyrosine-phosphatase n=1 Tax=Haemonchus contortus TaxID=6289 RepID=W6NVZ4_HAECO